VVLIVTNIKLGESLNPDRQQLLRLLQLASPLLPVGGYSYSEGLESLIDRGIINDRLTLQNWIAAELATGAIRIETAMVDRAYLAGVDADLDRSIYWNHWLSAARETEELRHQSWQMGGSLVKLAIELTPQLTDMFVAIGNPCNYAIGFGIVAQSWQIDRAATILAYVHTWVANQLGVGIKSIPLGQTAGQQILWQLQAEIDALARAIPTLTDGDLYACSWGLSLASMQHETQYSRLFRS
jgi:urease accessory protein